VNELCEITGPTLAADGNADGGEKRATKLCVPAGCAPAASAVDVSGGLAGSVLWLGWGADDACA